MGIGWILPRAGNHFARLRRFPGHGLRCGYGSWNLPARLARERWGLQVQHRAKARAGDDGRLARACPTGPAGCPIAQTTQVEDGASTMVGALKNGSFTLSASAFASHRASFPINFRNRDSFVPS